MRFPGRFNIRQTDSLYGLRGQSYGVCADSFMGGNMDISFRRDISANNMVIENMQGFSKNDFKVKMLKNNDIGSLLKFDYEYINGRTNLIYDISSKQALSALLETEKLSYEMLVSFLSSLKNLADSLGEYLLDEGNVLLKKEYIFINPASNRFSYCYNPYYSGSFKAELGKVFDDFLSAVDYDEPEAVKLVYDLHRECHKENFTVDSMVRIAFDRQEKDLPAKEGSPAEKNSVFTELSGSNTAGENGPADAAVMAARKNSGSVKGEAGTYTADPADLLRELADGGDDSPGLLKKISVYLKGKSAADVAEDIDSAQIGRKIKEAKPLPSYKSYSQRINKNLKGTYGGRAMMVREPAVKYGSAGKDESGAVKLEAKQFMRKEDPEENQYGNKGKSGRRYLVGMNRQLGTVIEIDQFPFTVGKADRQTDAVISSQAVSDMHCRIHESIPGEEYFFEDLNSENGSRINNIKIDPYKKSVLMPGDIVMIADEEYCFR